MVTAFILINVKDKKVQNIADDLKTIEDVQEVHLVAGEYDLVAVVKTESNEKLSTLLTDKIIHTQGVRHTKTLISLGD